MATIKKSASGYQLRYRTPDGRTRSETFEKKFQAEDRMVEVEHAKRTGAYVDRSAGKKTFGEWWVECEEMSLKLRPSTRARDASYAKRYLLPHFGRMQLGRIDHLTIAKWAARLSSTPSTSGEPLAPATVVKAMQLLSRTLSKAVEAGLIASNPAKGVERPEIKKEEQRFLTPSEVLHLADTIDRRFRGFVLLGAYGGLRFGELAALRRKNVDLLRGTVRVAESVTEVSGKHHSGPPKTEAGRRTVPLPRSVLNELEPSLSKLGPNDLVFPAPEGGFLRGSLFRPRIWHPAVERAGLSPLRCHDLRHTAVALWIAAGATPNEIKARAGHESAATVLIRYGHLLPGMSERVTDALDALAMSAVVPEVASVTALRGARV